MIISQIGYSYNDLTIIPAVVSDITSRSQCNARYANGMLPIFASCMSTVVSDTNVDEFIKNGIIPIVPRNISIEKRQELMEQEYWVALSLKEFSDIFIYEYTLRKKNIKYNICIDIANGHMCDLYDKCMSAKRVAANDYDLTIMTGNIANPETYQYICDFCTYEKNNEKHCAIDYIRLGIGTGSQCTTTSNVGIHYPIASLIQKCAEIRHNYNGDINVLPKIVADGGIRNFDHVIKAIALGADYVMVGGLFASFYESAAPLMIAHNDNNWSGPKYVETDYQYTSEDKKRNDVINRSLYKECYGMSTKKAQSLIGKATKTAEGKHTMMRVQYTIKQWSDNMESYLRSAMSYCGANDLYHFIGTPNLIVNSPGTMLYVNK